MTLEAHHSAIMEAIDADYENNENPQEKHAEEYADDTNTELVFWRH